MNLSKFLQSIKEKIAFFLDQSEQGLTPAVYRDWVILVSAFSLITLVFAGIGLYLFLKINNEEIFLLEKQNIQTQKTIDQVKLKEVIVHHEEKEKQFQELFSERPRVVDPAL